MRVVTSLDGLRGLAVAGVLLFHTGHLPGGFLGVDLFFALSGYLITAQLLRTPDLTLTEFWERRIRRLFPALLVLLTVTVLLVWAFGSERLRRTTLTDGPWAQASLVNWHLLAESAGYWDRFGEPRVFAHLWSIAVEEQFYLGWPVAVLIAGRRRTGWVAATGAVVSLLVAVALVDPADPSRVYTGTDTRAFALLLGALAAAVPVPARTPAAVPSALLAAGIGAAWLLTDDAGDPAGLFLYSLAASALIALCVHDERTPVARALSWRPLRWAGGISYGLYLWHWPVIVLLPPDRAGLDGWAWTAVVTSVSVGAAMLSKHLVEEPVRFRARWARGRTGAAVLAAAMLVPAALWWLVPEPAPARVDVTDLPR
ncbi:MULTISPECIES: acyltransferase family protein [Catenuloplanes]|uniref:Peptidoglycan/LPS O-acetylase OafA/YrhL n=1 Tax=Catenuloplanes niger TaxID=587534 RepID=A0AAE3ZJP2_9ACTN|nr:acyltransferase [Catenuloplanes niger]MDR7321127.1 peptidoglycan/LPS O-acetylase OafA/YrhL [Catenuloplanes niger]